MIQEGQAHWRAEKDGVTGIKFSVGRNELNTESRYVVMFFVHYVNEVRKSCMCMSIAKLYIKIYTYIDIPHHYHRHT